MRYVSNEWQCSIRRRPKSCRLRASILGGTSHSLPRSILGCQSR
nr:MAG TPA: hypothetical protein [Caudoviricetes sp.]